MTSIKQQIPSYTIGMTDQPDERKKPGQVRMLDNVLPDVTLGLIKRPGLQHLANLDGAALDGKWHKIYVENTVGIEEQYICNISKAGDVRIWAAIDIKALNGDIIYAAGEPVTLVGQTEPTPLISDEAVRVAGPRATVTNNGYMKHIAEPDLQFLNIGASTLVCNRRMTPTMSRNLVDLRPYEAYVELSTIAYGRQYRLDVVGDGGEVVEFETITSLVIENESQNNLDGGCPFTGTTEVTLEAGSGDGYNVIDLNGSNPSAGTGGLFRLVVNGQPVPEAEPDSGDAYDCRYTATLDLERGGENYKEGERFQIVYKTRNWFVRVKKTTTVRVENALHDPVTTVFTPTSPDSEVVSAASILDDLKTTLEGETWFDGTAQYDEIKIIGNGLYLQANRPFAVTTPEVDLFNIICASTDDDYYYVFNETEPSSGTDRGDFDDLNAKLKIERNNDYFQYTGDDGNLGETFDDLACYGITSGNYIQLKANNFSSVNNVSDLAQQCKHGFIVKVVNTFDDSDDYYVQFFGNDNLDGPGRWEEIVKPGAKSIINPGNMPQLIRRSYINGVLSFVISPVDWADRKAGDNVTNPIPSFIQTTFCELPCINNMLLYRNRLVFLSGSNVILSQAGDLGNWFGDTALTVSPSDPIDIDCATDASASLYNGLVVNGGMVLFSRFSQFFFTTDGDVLSPQTAKVSLLCAFDYDITSDPVRVAANFGFFSTAGNDSVFWELSDIYRDGPPTVNELSKPVSRSLPANLNKIAASKEDGLIMAGKYGDPEVWNYRYYKQNNTDLQQAWFKWTMPGPLVHHWNDTRGKYWAVYDLDGTAVMNRFDLNQKLRSVTLEGQPYEYFVYLDNWADVGKPTYNAAKKRSEFTVPYTPQRDLYAYTLDTGPYRGNAEKVLEEDGVYYLPGNWSTETVAVGYEFEMKVEMPRFYVQRREGTGYTSDTSSSLTIHRVHFDFGTIGIFDVTLDRYGKDDYHLMIECTEMDGYDADRVAGYPDKQFTVPVYDRAENCTLTLTSKYPTPATLLSTTFEGDYTEKYYKRV